MYARLYTSTRRYGQLDMADFDAHPSRCRYLFCRATRGSQPPRTQDKSDRVDRGASTSSEPISISNAVTTVRSDGPRAPSESSYHQLTGSAGFFGNLRRKRSSGRGTLSFRLKRARTDLSLYLRTTLLEWDRQPTNWQLSAHVNCHPDGPGSACVDTSGSSRLQARTGKIHSNT